MLRADRLLALSVLLSDKVKRQGKEPLVWQLIVYLCVVSTELGVVRSPVISYAHTYARTCPTDAGTSAK